MKLNLCSLHSCHACPHSDFHLDHCSILQRGVNGKISKGLQPSVVSCFLPVTTCVFTCVMLNFGSADQLITLLLANDTAKTIDCHAWGVTEVFSDYFEELYEMNFEKSLQCRLIQIICQCSAVSAPKENSSNRREEINFLYYSGL